MKAQDLDGLTGKVYQPLECISTDYKGPFSVQSVHHHTGFYLIADRGSGAMWSYPCPNKGEDVLSDILRSFHDSVMVPSGLPTRYIHFDYDSVETGGLITSLLKEFKIAPRVSAPYCHHQNGHIERAVQTVLDRARTLLVAARAPTKFWNYALMHAAHLVNTTPKSYGAKTPHEILTGDKPDISRLIPWFCPGVYHVSKDERKSTWDPKAKLCRFLGYDPISRDCFKILSLPDGKILSRKDCVFDMETIQPNMQELLDQHVQAPEDLIEFESADTEIRQGKLVGDSTAPYFALTPDEYLEQQERDKHYAYFAIEYFRNDLVNLVVHPPIMLPPDPKNLEDALSLPDREEWIQAISKETDNFDSRDILRYAEDQNGHAMKTKLVFKYTYTNDYQLKRKVRFVVCGYSQIPELDYGETYAPTTTSTVTNMISLFCAHKDYHMATFDVEAAFLEGRADRQLFARIPKCLDKDGTRVEIVGNWYGLKQGPRIWNDQLNTILLKIGFERCPVHPCLYARRRNNVHILIGVHVDDGLMGCNKKDAFIAFQDEFCQYVTAAKVSDTVLKFTGTTMTVNREEHYVRLDHAVYIKQRFKDFTKASPVPMKSTINLRTAQPIPGAESLLADTGAFRFIADRARCDILTAVGEVSTGGSKDPSQAHTDTSTLIKRYLMTTADLYMQLGGLGKLRLFGYSDASYITDGNAKSRLGGCVFMNNTSGAIFSFSRNDTIRNILGSILSSLSHSSTESEIKAIDVLITELLHILDIARFVAGPMELPIIVYCDNQSANLIFETLRTNHKVKHLNMRIQAIREQIIMGNFAIHFVPTAYNVADILTKALPQAQFEFLRNILMQGHGGVWPVWDTQVNAHLALTSTTIQEF